MDNKIHLNQRSNTQDSLVGSMLGWYLEGPGFKSRRLQSPIELSIRERLEERFNAVRHKIRLLRIKFEVTLYEVVSTQAM